MFAYLPSYNGKLQIKKEVTIGVCIVVSSYVK
jgi:hypothetical protein